MRRNAVRHVLGIDGEHSDLALPGALKVDDSKAPALSAANGTPSHLSDTAGAWNDITEFRVRDQRLLKQRVLVVAQQVTDQSGEQLGFDEADHGRLYVIDGVRQCRTVGARPSPACTTPLSIPGVGLLTATAMVAATSGEVSHFHGARHFASWFGLTPKEHSSDGTRHLGRISKHGNRYLHMLLTHGARSVMRAASVAVRGGKTVDGLRQWALAVQDRSNHNKATCALAKKLARICYATLRDGKPFGTARLTRKLTLTAFALPA